MDEDDFEVPLPEELEEDKVEITDILGVDTLEPRTMEKLKKLLENDKKKILRLRKEKDELAKEVGMLTKNNSELVKLVEVLESEIKTLTDNISQQYRYSYEDGGWVEKGTGKKAVLEEVLKNPDINVINAQLGEILRLIKLHRGKIKHV